MRWSLVSLAVAGSLCAGGAGLAGQGAFGSGAPPRPASAPSAGTGAISGVVTDAATRQPIAAAFVRLSGSGSGVSVAQQALTDARGRFVFRFLPALANYNLATAKAGYTDVLGARFPAGTGASIALADGEWLSTVDIALWRLGSIGGRVVDERGEPVVGVPVRALLRTAAAGVWQIAAGLVSSTDDRGVYRLAGLEAGRYIITVPSVQAAVPEATSVATLAGQSEANLPTMLAAGQSANSRGLDLGTSRLIIGNYATPPPTAAGRPQAYPPLFYPDARSVNSATIIELRPGDSREGVDFALSPVPASRVSGRVTGVTGAKGLVLRLMSEGTEGLGVGSEVATALVRDDGTFVLLNVPAGRYTLQTQRTVPELQARGAAIMVGLPPTAGLVSGTGSGSSIDLAPERTTLAMRQTTGDDPVWARMRVDVASADITGLVVELHPTASLSGRLVFEGARTLVPLLSVEPANGDVSLAVAFTPRQGPAAPSDAFSVSGLKAGEYYLRPSAVLVKSIMAGGVDYTDRPFDVTSGSISDIEVTLTDKAASLAGLVRDGQGAPVIEGVVVAFPADPALWSRLGFSPPRVKSVSFFGKTGYSLKRLVKGDYNLVALEPSMRNVWQQPGFFAAAAGQATRVALEWGEAKTQDLRVSRVVVR